MHAGTLTRAATGDIGSLRSMADRSHMAGDGHAFIPSLICLVEALTFSRLAASAGCSNSKRHVVAMLAELSDALASVGDGNSHAFAAQAILLAETFASEGDDSLTAFIAARGG